MPAYKYESLPTARSIRLLRLEAGRASDSIHCSLRTASLDEQLPYYAISYTWNGDSLSETILCRDETQSLTELKTNPGSSLVLQKMRDSEYGKTELWIDAVCIDQSKREERESQIQLMKEIYSRAETTLVYLGEPKEPGHLAISLCEKIFDLTRKFKPPCKITFSNLHDFGLPAIESPEWGSLYDFYCQPWFKRVWIRQEYVRSRTVLMLYGGIWKPSQFYVTVDGAFSHNDYGLGQILRSIRQVDASGVRNLLKNQGDYWPEVAPATLTLTNLELLNSLLKTRNLNWSVMSPFSRSLDVRARDARDHVYGTLGLLDDIDMQHPDLLPNYGLTVEQTFTRAARYLLNKLGLEKFLRSCGLPRKLTTLPSWVPDWTMMKIFFEIDQEYVRRTFSAGGTEDPVWKVDVDCSPAVLSVLGTLGEEVDDVCHVLEIESTAPSGDLFVEFFWQTLDLVGRRRDRRPPSASPALAKSAVQAAADTALSHVRTYVLVEIPGVLQVFGRRLQLWRQKTPVPDSERADLELARARAHENPGSWDPSSPLSPSSSSSSSTLSSSLPTSFADISKVLTPLYGSGELNHMSPEEKENLIHHIRALNLTSPNMGFCATTSGHIGRVPPGTARFDKVCYMQGITAPCILRRSPDHPGKYSYIGQCYIDGMMHGEAFEGHATDLEPVQLI